MMILTYQLINAKIRVTCSPQIWYVGSKRMIGPRIANDTLGLTAFAPATGRTLTIRKSYNIFYIFFFFKSCGSQRFNDIFVKEMGKRIPPNTTFF